MFKGKSQQHAEYLSETIEKQGIHYNKTAAFENEKVNYGHIRGLNSVNLSALQQSMLFFSIAGSIGCALGQQVSSINPPTNSAITYDGSRRLNEQEIEKLVNEKVTLHPKLVGNKAAEEKCNLIKRNIIETANNPAFNNGHFFRPLTNPNFKAQCTDDLYLGHLVDDPAATPIPGRFFAILKTLLFNVNASNSDIPELASHEFIHADHFYLNTNKNSPCKVPDHEALNPIYPMTKEEMKKYDEALNKGITRAKEAKSIFIKHIQGMVLTTKEQKIYDKYSTVLQGCWGLKDSKETQLITKEKYQQVKDYIAQNGETPFMKFKDGSQRRILDVYMKKNGRFYMNYEATSTVMAVIENLATVEDILNKGHFSKIPNEQKFSEKEAFILQSLHDAAIDLIIPEVKILRNSYIARCSAEKPSENSMKFELR